MARHLQTVLFFYGEHFFTNWILLCVLLRETFLSNKLWACVFEYYVHVMDVV